MPGQFNFLFWIDSVRVLSLKLGSTLRKGLSFKILLILDNAVGYPEPYAFSMKGIKVVYLSPKYNVCNSAFILGLYIGLLKLITNSTLLKGLLMPWGRNPIEHLGKDYTIEDTVILENARKAFRPRTINYCWRKLCRCCAWLHSIYDRVNQGN